MKRQATQGLPASCGTVRTLLNRFAPPGTDPALIVILFPDGDELFLVLQQDIHQARVKMLAALLQKMGEHLVPGPGLMVDPLVGPPVSNCSTPS